jgi:hypothetical protein
MAEREIQVDDRVFLNDAKRAMRVAYVGDRIVIIHGGNCGGAMPHSTFRWDAKLRAWRCSSV